MSRSYRKRGLTDRGERGEGGGEKISQSMGMGPKENTAQTPDVETPCTHTHIYINTKIESEGGNEGHKAAPLGVA